MPSRADRLRQTKMKQSDTNVLTNSSMRPQAGNQGGAASTNYYLYLMRG